MPTPKRHRSFGKKKTAKLPPISFDLRDETFEAHPNLPGIVLLEYASTIASADDEENNTDAANMILDLFEQALLSESYERFMKLARDPEADVDTEELSEIIGWLLEQYTDRPTEAS